MNGEIKYLKKLEEGGISRDNAEIQIGVVKEMMQEYCASKDDLKREISSVRNDLTSFYIELKNDISSNRVAIAEVATLIHKTESDLKGVFIKTISILLAGMGLATGVILHFVIKM